MHDSKTLYAQAKKTIPGGVNSPVRAFNGVGGDPIFIKNGNGAYITAEDGKEYIDYVGSWGPLILGHANPMVLDAVQKTMRDGLSFGAPTKLEIELAELVCECVPSMEMVRMVSSGTEATMTAIRLARGYTGRDKILKFNGCYHGHADCLLVKAGSGLLTLGIPSSKGVPNDFTKHTLTAEFNDLESVKNIFQQYGAEIAAIIVEPVPCNMNCILPEAGFLQGLRQLCDDYESLLIFDEVITGFRLGLSGAQGFYDIKPDLTCLGKILGGGMPVGAFGGRKEIMECMAPLGPVYQAGTLSGNPVAMSAGLATIRLLKKENPYAALAEKTKVLTTGLLAHATKANIPLRINQIESIFGLFFTSENNITSYSQVANCDIERFKRFYHGMLDEGIYLAPSAFEAGFISTAHGNFEIESTLNAAEKVFITLKG